MTRGQFIRRATVTAILLLAAVVVAGKFAGFGCAGRQQPMTARPSNSSADLIEGNWLGTWASNQRDMGGELRCRIEKLPSGDYRAQFNAVFAKVFTNESLVTLRVDSKGSSWTFSGEEDLGMLKGGIYKYTGRSDGQEFVCDYDSRYDKGTFRMKRVAPPTTTPSP